MQPTAQTSTVAPRLACSTASSNRFCTSRAPDERQPAAVQTRILTGFRAASSFSAISWSSTRSMFQPSFHPPLGLSGLDGAADLAVEDHDRRQAAGTQAPGGLDRDERAVFPGFPVLLGRARANGGQQGPPPLTLQAVPMPT